MSTAGGKEAVDAFARRIHAANLSKKSKEELRELLREGQALYSLMDDDFGPLGDKVAFWLRFVRQELHIRHHYCKAGCAKIWAYGVEDYVCCPFCGGPMVHEEE